YRPAAIKLWGGIAYAEGYMAWKAATRVNTPVLFDYWLGVPIEWPYARPDDPTDLFLTTRRLQITALVQRHVAASRIITVGSLRYDGSGALGRLGTSRASRRALGIPDQYGLYVLWDPNATLRGFLTAQEQ